MLTNLSKDFLKYILKFAEAQESTPKKVKLNHQRLFEQLVDESCSERLKKGLNNRSSTFQKIIKKLHTELKKLEEVIRFLEVHKARIYINGIVEGNNNGILRDDAETINKAILKLKEEKRSISKLLRTVSPDAVYPKDKTKNVLTALPMDKTFFFYEDYGKCTGRKARNLKELAEQIMEVESSSIRFHLDRGDFQFWLNDLGCYELSSNIESLEQKEMNDAQLRKQLCKIITDKIKVLEQF